MDLTKQPVSSEQNQKLVESLKGILPTGQSNTGLINKSEAKAKPVNRVLVSTTAEQSNYDLMSKNQVIRILKHTQLMNSHYQDMFMKVAKRLLVLEGDSDILNSVLKPETVEKLKGLIAAEQKLNEGLANLKTTEESPTKLENGVVDSKKK